MLAKYFPLCLFDELNELVLNNKDVSFSPNGEHPKWEQWTSDDKLYIRFLLAGYPKESLSIEAFEDKLTVKAERVSPEPKPLLSNLACRGFRQEFYCTTAQWDLVKAETSYKDGLLLISIPLKEKCKGKLLTID